MKVLASADGQLSEQSVKRLCVRNKPPSTPQFIVTYGHRRRIITSTTIDMDQFFTHNSQRSLRTNIFPANGARDENIVTITKDDGTTSDGGEGEVTELNSAMSDMLIIVAGIMSSRQLLAHDPVQISDDEDSKSDEGFLDWLDLSGEGETTASPAISSDSDVPAPPLSSRILPRNPPIGTPFLSLDDCTYNGIRLHPRVFVELRDGDFMKIVHIVKDTMSSEVTIRGWIFRRTRKTKGIFNAKRNEVCWLIYIDDDDPRDHSIQGLETRRVTEVIKRRQIRLTNQPFPDLSYRDDRISESDENIEAVRVLVCRYKYLIHYPNAKARISSHPWSEQLVLRLRADDCDRRPDNDAKDEDIRTAWRGETVPGGSQEGWLPGEKEYLRQESVSHRGIKANQSLSGPAGLEYPAGDPMTRGNVGTLLGVHDLNPIRAISSNAPNRTTNVPFVASTRHATIDSDKEDAVMLVSSDPHKKTDIASAPIPPRDRNKRKRSPTFTFDEDYDVSDQESRKDSTIILDLTQSLRESSIEPRRQERKPSKVIKINAKGETWSNSGIDMERTEDITTARSHPQSGISGERQAVVQSFNTPPGYSNRKRVEVRRALMDRWEPKVEVIDLSRPHTKSFSSPKPGTLAPLQSIPRFATQLSSATLIPPKNIALTLRRRLPARPFPYRRYTFGDCFCGAGGMSRGAINAGLRIAWGFDISLPACRSYQLNFLGTPIYHVWANDFSNCKRDLKCDICHLSPPCQFFSPLHTSNGKNDELNTASLFAIEALLKKAKPRVVTLEETAGLVKIGLHIGYFNAVINMFTSQGFSVRWKVLCSADYGVPQQRKRLVIIASCPGEVLPPFPAPTHSKDPAGTGLKPWTTINQAIDSIPANWPNHDVDGANKYTKEPYSGDRTANCITTTGNGACHPSGTRSFTHRELACLQKFPLGHKFGSVEVRKQIGNAVPPTLATVILEEVKKALMKADGLL